MISLRVLLAVACCASSIAFAAENRRPNILWIVAENIGPDLGCYGAALVQTPALDALAREGMRYRLAFATAPFCSPSRTAFMTGMYQNAIGAAHHRSHRHDSFCLPAGIRPLPHWLASAGYYTANIRTIGDLPVGTAKTDLNFKVEGEPLRQRSGGRARNAVGGSWVDSAEHEAENDVRLFHSVRWEDLATHQPFFAQVNLPVVERTKKGWRAAKGNPWKGQTHMARISPDSVKVPPYYPDHPITREDWAGYLDAVCALDDRAAAILRQLEQDGLADDTVVIFFADNGRLEHRGLGWCYDSGDRVPLIARWPKNFPQPPQYQAGTVSEQLVSLLDLTATTLAIAGVPKPPTMQSRVFLGALADSPRTVVFSARDRHDEAVQRIRAARNSRYRYIRNLMPEIPFMAMHRYKDACYPVVPLLRALHREGKLSGPPLALMAPRLPSEELYDLETDPHEIHNLIGSSSPEHQHALQELRAALEKWRVETNDHAIEDEPPEVLAEWRRYMHEWFGTPVLEAPFAETALGRARE